MIKNLFRQPWFWPQDAREDPGFINRMGRVFHWTWVIISGALFAIAAFNGAFWIWQRTGDFIQGFIFGLVSGIAAWMIGRGGRYIFSGE